MSESDFMYSLLESAERIDRRLRPERIAQLKKSYAFFRQCGIPGEEIKRMMAVTEHEMRLMRPH